MNNVFNNFCFKHVLDYNANDRKDELSIKVHAYKSCTITLKDVVVRM